MRSIRALAALALASCAALPWTAMAAAPDPAALMQKAATAKGAVTTPAGVVVAVSKPGKGAAPTASDWVRVHYTLRHPGGPEIESSRRLGQPAVVDLAKAGPCFQEGMQQLKPGARALLTCPAETVHGAHGSSLKPTPGQPLEFKVELLGVVKHP